jgi:hypothetical protein
MRDYIKYLKRGYARTTHLTSMDIRGGVLNRREGEVLVDKHERMKPQSLELFLKFLQINEGEFNEIVLKHAIDPWEGKIPIKIGKAPHDYGSWGKKLLNN